MIAFTTSDPDDPETLNNRKTSRQLLMYKPNNGLLLQSRMYNTNGGTHGVQVESKVYRDLIQREISACENVPNLWRTFKYIGNEQGVNFSKGNGFGGYPDWQYSEFHAVFLFHENDLDFVYTHRGDSFLVCSSCRDECCYLCEVCQQYFTTDSITFVEDTYPICDQCLNEHYHMCEDCDEYHHREDMVSVIDSVGHESLVCDACADENYILCRDCERYVHINYTKHAHHNGNVIDVYLDCLSNYKECELCNEYYHEDEINDNGLCPNCAKRIESFIYPTQADLFIDLCEMYRDDALITKDKFIVVKGNAPIMLVANLDTVHKTSVKDLCKTKRGVGAKAFADAYADKKLPKGLSELKLIVEIDRRGKDDAVYYSCANNLFEDYITSKGFKTSYGLFSDISIIAPTMGVAAVNLSSGYYNAHTQHEYINRRQINATIKKVNEIVREAAELEFPKFEYIEYEHKFHFYKHAPNSNDEVPKNLPEKYISKYKDLMFTFNVKELEYWRRCYGDEFVDELHEYVFNVKPDSANEFAELIDELYDEFDSEYIFSEEELR